MNKKTGRKQNRKKAKLILAAVALLLLAIVALDSASSYMLSYSLECNNSRDTTLVRGYTHFRKTYPALRPWLDSLQRCGALRDTFITVPAGKNAGERQHALYARSPQAHGRTALLVHGYGDNCTGMLHIAYIYNKVMGYNIILPDLHGHGLSQGNDIQMGWMDRLDILHWATVARGMFGTAAQAPQMVIHGISMGAATTMCAGCTHGAAGEPTPSYIRCFVEDCGYTSVWDEFRHELKKRFHLPAFPLMYTTSALCRLKYGWSFGQASPQQQVARCRKPMLFIHGSADTFVPTEMVYPLYAAKPAPKELWIARGSAHAQSYKDHPAEYTRRVAAFVGRYILP